MNDKEVYVILSDYQDRVRKILLNYINKIDVKEDLKKLNNDLYELKEKYKKIEAVQHQSNASNNTNM